MIRTDGFCYVEPRSAPTEPVVDGITRRATALLRSCTLGRSAYRGVHGCTGPGCQAHSDNRDHFIPDPDRRITHSLLVHYVACHRSDLSPADLDHLEGLTDEEEPTRDELLGSRVLF